MIIESSMGRFQRVKVMDNSCKKWDGKLYTNFLEYDNRLSCFYLVENDKKFGYMNLKGEISCFVRIAVNH